MDNPLVPVLASIVLLSGLGGTGWGLLTLDYMSGPWFACGLVFSLLAAYVLFGLWVRGMDTYAERTAIVFWPLILLSLSLVIWCLGALIWKGIGIEIDVSVHG